MPGMDGAELLTTISVRWPRTMRIALTGYTESALAVRLAPIAHVAQS